MPDVEVKLDIKAEYQQALNAISEMGKALEDVQNKAKVVINKTNSATANGEFGNDDMSMKDIADMKKATQELAVLLVQASAAAERARGALSRIADMEIITPQDVTVLERAAAGYDELAKMANAAAEATERFNAAGKAGLTTEEMIRMTQAAEKQLETLRAQSEALERSIAAQREQLNVLIRKNAEEAKAAQLTKEKNKQEQLNIALLDRQAKAEEEATFKMQLAGKTRLELSAIYKELAQKAKEAAAAQDAEAAAKYERQMQLVNQALRKVNMSARIANIALMQQAQAAQRIGQNLETLTTGFSGLGEALENGTLNITSMGSAFVSMMRDFKAGLGPIGWVMLALQGLQAVWNNYAQTKKKVAEAEAENKKILENEKTLYEELKTAREEYDAQVALATSLKSLNDAYEGIKTKLQDSLRLIEDSTKAELVRLNLVKSQEEYTRIQKRYELGRAFKRGDITEDQYKRELLNLEQAQKISEAEKNAADAKAKVEDASKKAQTKSDVAKETMERWGEAAKRLNAFNVDEASISRYEDHIKDQKKIADAEEKKATEILEKAGVSQKWINHVFDKGLTKEFYSNLGTFQISTGDLVVLANVLKNRKDALESSSKSQSELSDLLGGRTAKEYRTQKKAAQQEEEVLRQQKDETNAAARSAWQDVRNMPTVDYIENQRKNEIKQIEAIIEEKIKDLENDIAIAQENQQRQAALEAVRKSIQNISTKDIEAELGYLAPLLGSGNTREKAFAEQMSAIYREERNRRNNEIQEAKNIILKDGKIDKKDEPYLNGLLNAAKAGGEADKELFNAVMAFIRKQNKNVTMQKGYAKIINQEIGR